MAEDNVLKHLTAGAELTQAEDDAAGRHVAAGAAENDIPIFNASEQLVNKTPASVRTILGADKGARVYNSAAQAIGSSSWTVLAFDSEDYDTDTIHDTVTNNNRLTCVSAGKYLITINVSWEANATGRRIISFRKNGADARGLVTGTVDSSNLCVQVVMTILDLSATDYIEARVFQTSGGELDLTSDITYAFAMQRIG